MYVRKEKKEKPDNSLLGKLITNLVQQELMPWLSICDIFRLEITGKGEFLLPNLTALWGDMVEDIPLANVSSWGGKFSIFVENRYRCIGSDASGKRSIDEFIQLYIKKAEELQEDWWSEAPQFYTACLQSRFIREACYDLPCFDHRMTLEKAHKKLNDDELVFLSDTIISFLKNIFNNHSNWLLACEDYYDDDLDPEDPQDPLDLWYHIIPDDLNPDENPYEHLKFWLNEISDPKSVLDFFTHMQKISIDEAIVIFYSVCSISKIMRFLALPIEKALTLSFSNYKHFIEIWENSGKENFYCPSTFIRYHPEGLAILQRERQEDWMDFLYENNLDEFRCRGYLRRVHEHDAWETLSKEVQDMCLKLFNDQHLWNHYYLIGIDAHYLIKKLLSGQESVANVALAIKQLKKQRHYEYPYPPSAELSELFRSLDISNYIHRDCKKDDNGNEIEVFGWYLHQYGISLEEFAALSHNEQKTLTTLFEVISKFFKIDISMYDEIYDIEVLRHHTDLKKLMYIHENFEKFYSLDNGWACVSRVFMLTSSEVTIDFLEILFADIKRSQKLLKSLNFSLDLLLPLSIEKLKIVFGLDIAESKKILDQQRERFRNKTNVDSFAVSVKANTAYRP